MRVFYWELNHAVVDSICHSIQDLSGIFSVWHAYECHIAHWCHDSCHFYFVEWTWFLASFRFVVSKHWQACLICLIKRRKTQGREHDNGNLDDFTTFRENSLQGISQSARCCKNKSSWKLSVVKTLLYQIQVKVSDVFSSYVLGYLAFHVFCLIGIQ